MAQLDIIARLNNDYVYHKPTLEQAERYGELREEFRRLAIFIATSCPDSRERSLAFTYLEQACFSANASIARNEGYAADEQAADEEPDLVQPSLVQPSFESVGVNPLWISR